MEVANSSKGKLLASIFCVFFPILVVSSILDIKYLK